MKKLLFFLVLSVSFVGFNVHAASPVSIQQGRYYGNSPEIRDLYVGKVSSTGEFTVNLPYGVSYVGCSANMSLFSGCRGCSGLCFKLHEINERGSNIGIAQIGTRTNSGDWVYFTIYGDID